MSQKIKMYTLSTCSHCKACKRFMDENDIPYEYTDVDQLEGAERESVIAEVKRLNPQISFPTIVIGDNVIVGFKEERIREALGI